MSEQSSERGSQVKRKQMMLLLGVGAVGLIVAAGGTYLVTGKGKPAADPVAKATPINLVTGGSAYSEREAWREQLASDVDGMTKQVQALRKELGDRDAEVQRMARKEAERKVAELAPPTAPGSVQGRNDPGSASNPVASSGSGAVGAMPASTSPAAPVNMPPPPPTRKNGAPVFGQGTFGPPAGGVGGAAGGADGSLIGAVTFEDPKKAVDSKAVDGESGGVNEKQTAGSYIPAGTFARVVVLNGLDAPTGGQSQSNPGPVLLRIQDHANLPGGFKVDLRGCIVTGAGDGDVAAERARIRLDRLSCVDANGGAIDIQVRGYVAGEDGKAGMRGKLVTKTGQMLSNALLASVGSGIGEAFKSGSETTTANPLGGATTVTKPGDGFQRGFGSGTQRAFDMLARYYIQLAEKTFPVVEVEGGRVADVVFSRGFVLEGR